MFMFMSQVQQLYDLDTHLKSLSDSVALLNNPLSPLISSSGTVRQERCSTDDLLQPLLQLWPGKYLNNLVPLQSCHSTRENFSQTQSQTLNCNEMQQTHTISHQSLITKLANKVSQKE